MLDEQTAFDCRTEVEDLHRFFTDWFNGAQPDTDATWSMFEHVMAPGFALVTPGGQLLERAALLESLRPLHGQHPPEAEFAISIRGFAVRHIGAEVVVATYEEWQTLNGAERGRLSTAAFERNPAMPNRVRWLHVHETWLPA